ncbi:LuxR C-terminal-related transcriptional regulator [Rhizobium sp. FKY42]|uniref:LuxR C-terminal-related transcriptional regulator n=1 Tax=Rhizobium sp. FKY42 TaxID=2562310 RepID=UPI001485163F|nr:LuxR C-terminal-related transcriptional regulator [Rhizobium sp. FKY42]
MKWSKTVELWATPPATGEDVIERPRLALDRFAGAGARLIDLSAPQGYGRTLLLSQWYAKAAAAGTSVVWLSMDGPKDASQFIQGLACASTRPEASLIDSNFAAWLGGTQDPIEALTGWILEVQRSGRECLLILDDADLPEHPSVTEAMTFALANAPGNLAIALSTNPGHPIFRQSAFFGTPLMRLTARELRFTEDETAALAQRRFPGENISDLAEQVHRHTDGWPLGVQLALLEHITQGRRLPSEKAMTQALGAYFSNSFIDRLPPELADLLTHLANLDPLHRDLVETVVPKGRDLEELRKLAYQTPLFVRAENGDWMRLHAGVKEILQRMQAKWPQEKRKACALAAAHWYAGQEMYEQAADQARLVGDTDLALELAGRAMRGLKINGQTGDVLRWLDSIPPEAAHRHPQFWLAGAWAYANSSQPRRMAPLLTLLRAAPDTPEADLAEADLIEAAQCAYSDDLAGLARFSARWPDPALEMEPLLHGSIRATELLLRGQPVAARSQVEAMATHRERLAAAPFLRALIEAFRAVTLLWEGKPQLALDIVRPALAEAESEMHPRNGGVTNLVALLAYAAVEIGDIDLARTALAARLPLIERAAMPDTIIFGFHAAASLSEREKRFDIAEVQLEGLVSTGQARALPRLESSGLSRLVRMHARHDHEGLARAALERLEGLIAQLPKDMPQAQRTFVTMQQQLARAACIFDDPHAAVKAGQMARSLAQELRRGRDQLLAQSLIGRALLAMGDGRGQRELQEVVASAHAWGLKRLRDEAKSYMPERPAPASTSTSTSPAPEASSSRSKSTGILTGREHDVLVGISAYLTNKEIALSLGLSDETVRWHMKNLFQKLEATDRKMAVARARMLGVL